MLSPLLSATGFAGIGANSIAPADLYAKVSKTLLAQSAGVQKISAALGRDQTRLSGLGQLHSALATFQSVARSLGGLGVQTAATPSAPGVLSAVTTGTAKLGTYAVEVKQLAQGQVLSAKAQQSKSDAIGSGAATTIKIEFGTTSGSSFKAGATAAKSIVIDSGNNTLQGIADAFKAAGVDARIVRDGKGYTLGLHGEEGGANSLRISVGGDAALQKLLAYNPSGTQGLTESKAAQDALLSVDGKPIASASNVVTGAIEGTALALLAKGSSAVVVAQDAGQIATNVNNFVTSYNNLNDRLRGLQQGELRADPVLGRASAQLAELLAPPALAKVGITADRDGKLQLNATTLQGAVAADADAVAKLFTDAGNGIADKLASRIGQLIGDNGSVRQQAQTVGRSIAALSTRKADLTRALTARADALVAQYAKASQTGYDTGNTISALPGLPNAARTLFDYLA